MREHFEVRIVIQAAVDQPVLPVERMQVVWERLRSVSGMSFWVIRPLKVQRQTLK